MDFQNCRVGKLWENLNLLRFKMLSRDGADFSVLNSFLNFDSENIKLLFSNFYSNSTNSRTLMRQIFLLLRSFHSMAQHIMPYYGKKNLLSFFNISIKTFSLHICIHFLFSIQAWVYGKSIFVWQEKDTRFVMRIYSCVWYFTRD